MIQPVKSKDVVAQMSPVQAGDNGGIEHFLEREHPGVLRHGEHKVVFLSKPANITSNFINEELEFLHLKKIFCIVELPVLWVFAKAILN